MPSLRPPIYQGYTGWPDGLSVWPSKRRSRRWADLEEIHTFFLPDNCTVRTTFRFRSGKTVTLRASRDFSWTGGRGRFAEIVALAVAAAPKEAHINQDTTEMALHGARGARRAALRPAASRPDADALVRRARHHRVWMELPKALSLVKEALRQQPAHAEALRLRCHLYWQFGRPKEARRAAQEWLAVRPSDPEAKRNLLQIELALDDPNVVEEARAVLTRAPDNPALAAALAEFLFRRGGYEEAAAIWDRAGAAAIEPAVRSVAAERAAYVRRFAADARFRRHEKGRAGRRTALIVALALVPLVLLAGLQVWRWREARKFNKRIEEIRRDLDQRMEETNRDFTELTGQILGSPEQIRARAEKGEPAAMFTYAEMLLNGERVAKDVKLGLSYLERAADADSMEAQKKFAAVLLAGEMIEKDPARAAELFQRAADLGSPFAAMSLGEMYLKGEGVAVSKAAALGLFEKAAEGGNLYGMKRAGWALESGEGVDRDLGRALLFYRRAAERDDQWAIERLARILSRKGGESYDPEEAWDWVRKGAVLGSPKLRLIFAGGVLTAGRSNDEKASSALPWLIEAADRGDSASQGLLGSCYLNGWGVPQDFANAAEWFAKSEPTQEKSRALLGLCHAFGLGLERDLEKARALRSRINDPAEQKWLDRYLEGAGMVAAPSRTIVPLFQDQPRYPIHLSREGIEGRVLLAFTVDREGFVRDVRVVESTRTEFEAPARLAISCWKFSPMDGRDSINVQLPMSFNLTDRSTEEVEAGAGP